MKTAVITLDLINDICTPNGKIARFSQRINDKQIIEKANIATQWSRKNNHLTIHVRVGFHDHYQEASPISPIFSQVKNNQALNVCSWGGQFCKSLDINKRDLIITKHRVSAFYGTNLELVLRANRIERLILLGVATNNAVELTAREAHDRDYQVSIIDDATETASDEEQQASLHFLKKISNVITLNDLLTS